VNALVLSYLALASVWLSAYFVLPGLNFGLWALNSFAGAALTVYGMLRNRPRARRSWYLVAAAVSSFTLGDVAKWANNPTLTELSNLFYLASYVLLIIALLGFVRARTAGRDLPALLDALALTTGLGLLIWVFVMVPYASAPDLALGDKLTSLVLPLADLLLLLAVLVRLLSGGGIRSVSLSLLGLSVACLLIGDTAVGLATLQHSFAPGGPIDLPYLLFPVLLALSAMHPSMTTMSEPTEPSDLRPTPARLTLLAGASLIAPGVLITQWALHRVIDAPVIAVACVVLFGVPMVRIFWLAAEVTRQGERKRMLGRVLQATEEERTRIASDLHDGPVQALAILSYNAHRARRKLSTQDLESADKLMGTVEQSLEEEVKVLRRLMSDLRPPVLDNRGLAAALSEQVTNFERDHQIDSAVDVALASRLAPELETVLYRVVQESLNNIAKHAGAQHVGVEVVATNGNVVLKVSDDGVGFQAGEEIELLKGGHYGLAGMRERVAMAGGRLDVQSAPGRGTTIEVALPVVHREGDDPAGDG
jgi:signal transduction histidine kinase